MVPECSPVPAGTVLVTTALYLLQIVPAALLAYKRGSKGGFMHASRIACFNPPSLPPLYIHAFLISFSPLSVLRFQSSFICPAASFITQIKHIHVIHTTLQNNTCIAFQEALLGSHVIWGGRLPRQEVLDFPGTSQGLPRDFPGTSFPGTSQLNSCLMHAVQPCGSSRNYYTYCKESIYAVRKLASMPRYFNCCGRFLSKA
jgi:hypothetical protein